MTSLALVAQVQPFQDTTTLKQSNPACRHVYHKLQEFSHLSDNWDSYGALAPTSEAMLSALQLTHTIFTKETPLPDVFPVPNGSVQIEWSLAGLEMEIEVVSQDKFILYFENFETDELIEEVCSIEFSSLVRAMGYLHEKALSNLGSRFRLAN